MIQPGSATILLMNAKESNSSAWRQALYPKNLLKIPDGWFTSTKPEFSLAKGYSKSVEMDDLKTKPRFEKARVLNQRYLEKKSAPMLPCKVESV